MKAYVIKNKEGKYRDKDGWLTDKIVYADKFESQEEAQVSNNMLKDEQLVEVTIAEGDLEQQIEEKELEAIRWEEHFNNAKLDYKILEQENAVLKKALELACDFAGLDIDEWSKGFIEEAKRRV